MVLMTVPRFCSVAARIRSMHRATISRARWSPMTLVDVGGPDDVREQHRQLDISTHAARKV